MIQGRIQDFRRRFVGVWSTVSKRGVQEQSLGSSSEDTDVRCKGRGLSLPIGSIRRIPALLKNYKRSGIWFRRVERDFVYVVAKVARK